MLHNPADWPAFVIGSAWLFLLVLSTVRLWGGLRRGRVRWGAMEIERAGDPSGYWRYVGVYSIVPALTLALAIVLVVSLGASSS
jgi:hypothetical protein